MTDTETDTLDVLEDHDTVAKGEIVGCGVKETLAEEDTDAELLVVLDDDADSEDETVGLILGFPERLGEDDTLGDLDPGLDRELLVETVDVLETAADKGA